MRLIYMEVSTVVTDLTPEQLQNYIRYMFCLYVYLHVSKKVVAFYVCANLDNSATIYQPYTCIGE